MPKNFKKINIIVISSYPPRECGVATYTRNLCNIFEYYNRDLNISIISPLEKGDKTKYSAKVVNFIEKDRSGSYKEIASYINDLNPSLVFLQHEFGLFGGQDGVFILQLLRNLKIPVVTYLHTIPLLSKSNNKKNKIEVVKKIFEISQKIIVPAKIVLEELVTEYNFSRDKLDFIKHGTPNVEYISQVEAKKILGLKYKRIISSIGLINLHKGIDLIIEALPEIISQNQDVVYYIIGQAHPKRKKEVDNYLKKIKKRVKNLGLEKNVKRIDKYLDEKELIKYFQASDIYLTPYNVPEQVSSGTLAYAFACGRCTISTPYIYAKELIGNNERGLLVNYNDPKDIAEKVNYILNNPKEQKIIEKKAYKFGRKTIWENIAKKHLGIFEEVLRNK